MTGHMPTRTSVTEIEFLYDPDCPSHEAALDRLRSAMEDLGSAATVSVLAVTSHEQAHRLRFLGSPTIRVDGRDIDDGSADREDFSLTCRAYVRPDGRISPLPPETLIRDALLRAAETSSQEQLES
jgi:hypothetical protein